MGKPSAHTLCIEHAHRPEPEADPNEPPPYTPFIIGSTVTVRNHAPHEFLCEFFCRPCAGRRGVVKAYDCSLTYPLTVKFADRLTCGREVCTFHVGQLIGKKQVCRGGTEHGVNAVAQAVCR